MLEALALPLLDIDIPAAQALRTERRGNVGTAGTACYDRPKVYEFTMYYADSVRRLECRPCRRVLLLLSVRDRGSVLTPREAQHGLRNNSVIAHALNSKHCVRLPYKIDKIQEKFWPCSSS